MKEEWKKSTLLINLSEIRAEDAWLFPHLTNLSKMLATLRLIGIWQEQLNIERLSVSVWAYTTNYYMSRIPHK